MSISLLKAGAFLYCFYELLGVVQGYIFLKLSCSQKLIIYNHLITKTIIKNR